MAEVSSLAVFVDFENLALGFQSRKARFDIRRVLQRLVEKGKIIVKKGYADWSRFADYKRQLHESGLELIEIPRRAMTGKNSADIRLCVDAMDLCYSKEHIDTFVIVSGDSDFSPLVAKLKENGKRVIGLAMRKSTSNLLADSCDEFIFYEDLEESEAQEPTLAGVKVSSDKQEVFRLLLDTLVALRREDSGPIYSSIIKDTMKRKQPYFNESAYGYRTFSELLEDARSSELVVLSTDTRSGTYVVTEFKAPPRKRTRRGGRGRRGGRARAVPAPSTGEATPATEPSENGPEDSKLVKSEAATEPEGSEEEATTATGKRKRSRRRPSSSRKGRRSPAGAEA